MASKVEKSQNVIDEMTDDQIQAVLSSFQNMFYQKSSFKDGPNAGKLNLTQFEDGKWSFFPLFTILSFSIVLKTSRQFVLNNKMSTEYFSMLDIDGDN